MNVLNKIGEWMGMNGVVAGSAQLAMASAGSACGAGDPVKPSACGAADPDPKPSACGSACGAADPVKK